jgi:cytochrome c peroxidase
VTSLVAFIRSGFDVSGAVKIGDSGAARLFAGKAGCATCHRVNGVGPRTAPDLSDIGTPHGAVVSAIAARSIERDVAD